MQQSRRVVATVIVLLSVGAGVGTLGARMKGPGSGPSSYKFPVDEPPFRETFAKGTAAKAGVMARQMALLNSRYDLSDRPAAGVTMSRGKAIQEGGPVRLPAGEASGAPPAVRPRASKANGRSPA